MSSASGSFQSVRRYLCWAFMEVANYAMRFDPQIRRWYERKRRVVEKAPQTIVAALDDVLRNAGKVESGLSGHCLMIGAGAPPR